MILSVKCDGILWVVGVLSKASKKVKNRESEVDGG